MKIHPAFVLTLFFAILTLSPILSFSQSGGISWCVRGSAGTGSAIYTVQNSGSQLTRKDITGDSFFRSAWAVSVQKSFSRVFSLTTEIGFVENGYSSQHSKIFEHNNNTIITSEDFQESTINVFALRVPVLLTMEPGKKATKPYIGLGVYTDVNLYGQFSENAPEVVQSAINNMRLFSFGVATEFGISNHSLFSKKIQMGVALNHEVRRTYVSETFTLGFFTYGLFSRMYF